MRIAPESLRTVNAVLDKSIEKVELGKYYGNIADQTSRVIFNEELLHPFSPTMLRPQLINCLTLIQFLVHP